MRCRLSLHQTRRCIRTCRRRQSKDHIFLQKALRLPSLTARHSPLSCVQCDNFQPGTTLFQYTPTQMSCHVPHFMHLWHPWPHPSHTLFSFAHHGFTVCRIFQDCMPCEWWQFSVYCYIDFKEAFLIWILHHHKIRNPTDLYPKSEQLKRFTRLLERQCMELGNFKEA